MNQTESIKSAGKQPERAAWTKVIVFLALTFVLSASSVTNTSRAQSLELDHILILVQENAPEADILRSAGLFMIPDTSHHTGQGTAAVFFPFENIYLELIWVEDTLEFEQASAGLAARTSSADASPFGLGLVQYGGNKGDIPFATFPYFAPWMKPETSIYFAETSLDPRAPLIFVEPDYLGWRKLKEKAPKQFAALAQPEGIQRLTNLKISVINFPKIMDAINVLEKQEIASFEDTDAHLIELIFDDERQGKMIDARPHLPLIIHY